MTQMTNKTERFADYINKMDFFEVIEFFNFMMEDMMQIENHTMYEWTKQEDAEIILKNIGITKFVALVNSNTPEETAVIGATNGEGKIEFTIVNPWTEILDDYSNWILGHLDDCMNGKKDKTAILKEYPDIFDIVKEPKKVFTVRITEKAVYNVDIVAHNADEAMRIAAENRGNCPVWEHGVITTNYDTI